MCCKRIINQNKTKLTRRQVSAKARYQLMKVAILIRPRKLSELLTLGTQRKTLLKFRFTLWSLHHRMGSRDQGLESRSTWSTQDLNYLMKPGTVGLKRKEPKNHQVLTKNRSRARRERDHKSHQIQKGMNLLQVMS